MIDELHPDEVESVLHRHHVGRLATVVDGQPYLVPITYAYHDGLIYGHTMPGQKLDAMRAEPRVAFEVDERWKSDTWRSVVVQGVFEELSTELDRAAALTQLHGVYPDASRVLAKGVAFRIRPTAKSGRAVRRSGLFQHLENVEHPLQGLSLREGDERNFPSDGNS